MCANLVTPVQHVPVDSAQMVAAETGCATQPRDYVRATRVPQASTVELLIVFPTKTLARIMVSVGKENVSVNHPLLVHNVNPKCVLLVVANWSAAVMVCVARMVPVTAHQDVVVLPARKMCV